MQMKQVVGVSRGGVHWRPALDERDEDLESEAPDLPPLPPEDIVVKLVWLGERGGVL